MRILRLRRLQVAAGRTTSLRLVCPAHETGGCRGTVRLQTVKKVPARLLAAKRRRVTLVKKRFSIPGGKARTINLRLSRKSYRILLGLKKVKVRVIINARDPAGNRSTTRPVTTLRAPKKSARG